MHRGFYETICVYLASRSCGLLKERRRRRELFWSSRFNFIAKIDGAGNLGFASFYGYSDGSSATYYYRKSEGTFTQTGDNFAVKYSYETCSPVGQETLNIKVSNGKLSVYVPSTGYSFMLSRASGESTLSTSMGIEDRNCNILSKLESKEKRLPASAKAKSFFDRVLK